MTALVGGVSIADAAPGTTDPERPAPAGPDPAKVVAAFVTDAAGSDVPQRLDVPQGTAGGFVFVPVDPYRTYDSRNYSDGYLTFDEAVVFDVLTNEAGAAIIPAEAVAVTYNLTVANTTGGGGYLAIFPGDAPEWPATSAINWSFAGTVIANGGTVGIGTYSGPNGTIPGSLVVGLGGAATVGTDFILDITGYYI